MICKGRAKRGDGESPFFVQSNKNRCFFSKAPVFAAVKAGNSFYSGVFLICAQRRGYFCGVSATLRIRIALCAISVPGIV